MRGRGQYDPYNRELLAYYYNRAEAAGVQVAVAKKGEDLPEGVVVLNFERGRAEGILERPWETDTSVYQNSWGYINDIKYYTAADIRFTTKGETLYAICLGWPEKALVIESMGSKSPALTGKIARVMLVGHEEQVAFAQEERGLVVTMPDEKPCNCAYALRITMK